MNFSALEITLKIEQKSTFLDKKYKIVISYVPCEIFLDIKCLEYYLAEIKSKKMTFIFSLLYKTDFCPNVISPWENEMPLFDNYTNSLDNLKAMKFGNASPSR